MSDSPPQSDPTVEALLLLALEQQQTGLEPDFVAICAEHPEHLERVKRLYEKAAGLEELHVASMGGDTLSGTTLAGRYRLQQRLGAGSMGVVYRGLDQDLGREVAVKILRTPLMDLEEAEARFHREAEAMASVDHPGVIRVYDRGHTDDGSAFLVMELLRGCSLSDLLEQAPVGRVREDKSEWLAAALGREALEEPSYLRNAVRWTADLAGALHQVHEAGILHRDCKPSNIFIRTGGEPVLLDFGVATGNSLETLTQSGGTVGTPAYMPPEALQPRAEAKVPQDIYSLSASLYHMLALRPPFEGTASQVIHARLHSDPKPVGELRPGLPRDLQAVLDKGMEAKPTKRYASAQELEEDLRAFLGYRPVSARPISKGRRLARKAVRSRALLAALAVAFLAFALWGGASCKTPGRRAGKPRAKPPWTNSRSTC